VQSVEDIGRLVNQWKNDKGEKKEKKQWHGIVIFNKALAESQERLFGLH